MAEQAPRGESRKDEIVAAALELLEQDGAEAVSMRAIADRIGIKAPSLYKHYRDKDALEVAMIAAGFRSSAEALTTAIEDADDQLAALAAAYRGWALAHRHLYRLMTHKPLDRGALPVGVEEAAALPVMQVAGGDRARARALWAFAHGMTSLELAERFPSDADLDAAWAAGVAALRSLTESDPTSPDIEGTKT